MTYPKIISAGLFAIFSGISLAASPPASYITPEGNLHFTSSTSDTYEINPLNCARFAMYASETLEVLANQEKIQVSYKDPDLAESTPVFACNIAIGIGVAMSQILTEHVPTSSKYIMLSQSIGILPVARPSKAYKQVNETTRMAVEFKVRENNVPKRLIIPIETCSIPGYQGKVALVDDNHTSTYELSEFSESKNGITLLHGACITLSTSFTRIANGDSELQKDAQYNLNLITNTP